MNWQHLIWIPSVLVYYTIYYTLALYNNQSTTSWYQSKWFWYMAIWGIVCPLWLVVSRISKQIMIDGCIYDFCMWLPYMSVMLIAGQFHKFNAYQWVGLVVVFCGLLLLHADQEIIKYIK